MSEEDDDDVRKDLMLAVDLINAYYKELEGESPRAAAILAVCSLEDELQHLIKFKRFPRDIKDSVWKKIAGSGPTPLGSLYAKTNFGLAFGFYGSKTKNIINRIATVRNKFAHEADARDFDHPEVRCECALLAPNEIAPFTCTETSSASDIRFGFITLVERVEQRLAAIREHLPECGDPPLVPLP